MGVNEPLSGDLVSPSAQCAESQKLPQFLCYLTFYSIAHTASHFQISVGPEPTLLTYFLIHVSFHELLADICTFFSFQVRYTTLQSRFSKLLIVPSKHNAYASLLALFCNPLHLNITHPLHNSSKKSSQMLPFSSRLGQAYIQPAPIALCNGSSRVLITSY